MQCHWNDHVRYDLDAYAHTYTYLTSFNIEHMSNFAEALYPFPSKKGHPFSAAEKTDLWWMARILALLFGQVGSESTGRGSNYGDHGMT